MLAARKKFAKAKAANAHWNVAALRWKKFVVQKRNLKVAAVAELVLRWI